MIDIFNTCVNNNWLFYSYIISVIINVIWFLDDFIYTVKQQGYIAVRDIGAELLLLTVSVMPIMNYFICFCAIMTTYNNHCDKVIFRFNKKNTFKIDK